MINSAFQWLPIWGMINSKIFLVHGGISPDLNALDQIAHLKRPISDGVEELVADLLWSDPSQTTMGFDRSQRGSGVLFGQSAMTSFFSHTGMEKIIRGHQCVSLGISRFANGQLYTVFSCSRYEDLGNNRAGILFVNSEGLIKVYSLPPMDAILRDLASLKPVTYTGYNIEAPKGNLISLNLQITEQQVRNHSSAREISRKLRMRAYTTGSIKTSESSSSQLPTLTKSVK